MVPIDADTADAGPDPAPGPDAPMPDLDELSEETGAILARHYSEPVEDEAVLMRRLETYLDTVRAAFHKNEYLDIELVEKLGDMVGALLTTASELGEAERRLVHAGALYFLDPDDAEEDIGSNTGFGDDADVLVAICRHLDRNDLVPRSL